MKKFFPFICLLLSFSAFAQQDIATMRANARKFLQSGDIDNAILILNNAASQDAYNLDVRKELAQAYYFKKDYEKALSISKELLTRADADMAVFQLTGTAQKALTKYKDAEKTYKAGIKKFPASGPLYSEYGEVLMANNNESGAVSAWTTGMDLAPSYSGNYYNAAMYYFTKPEDKIWAILYGEIYANMESLNPKTNTIKKLLYDAYQQKLFAVQDLQAEANLLKNPFEKAVVSTYAKLKSITSQGISPETLSMIRTRFILDWSMENAAKYPFRLFDYHKQMLQEGLFDSYNQWMFGPNTNQKQFENWVITHKEEYDKFTNFHSTRIFKMPQGQVYSK